LVNTFPGYSQNSFEKWQLTACRFSKEFWANPTSLSTNRRRETALFCLQKRFVNSKGFDIKGTETLH
jgi:hypothetical protein